MKKLKTLLFTLLIVATLAVGGYAASNTVATATNEMTTLLRGSPPAADNNRVNIDRTDRVTAAADSQLLSIANVTADHSFNVKAAYVYNVNEKLSLIVSNTDATYMETPTSTFDIRINPPPLIASTNTAATATIPSTLDNARIRPPNITTNTTAAKSAHEANTLNDHPATARGPSNKIAMTTTDADNTPTLATARGSTGNTAVTVTDIRQAYTTARHSMDIGRVG